MGEELKVYQMNEYDWWADRSLDDARKNYTKWQLEEGGMDKEDIEVDSAVEMSEERMNKYMFTHDDLTDSITFKEQLERKPQQGFFASTEW